MSDSSPVQAFLARVAQDASSISFEETMQVIDACYRHAPCPFSVGEQHNESGQNNGSSKILAFARMHQLDERSTLNLFGDYYRRDVLEHPDGSDHANIRQFQAQGWEGVRFDDEALIPVKA
ncbi:MAG: HopJ type III effector protein [Oleiphilaceae bacterium]|nr:HopJ type III effector protein [Oleiphilaceae bacterium]